MADTELNPMLREVQMASQGHSLHRGSGSHSEESQLLEGHIRQLISTINPCATTTGSTAAAMRTRGIAGECAVSG